MDFLYQKQIEDYQFIKNAEHEQEFLEKRQTLEVMKTSELTENFQLKPEKPIVADAPKYDPKEKSKDKKKRIQREKQYLDDARIFVTPARGYISNFRGLGVLNSRVYQEFDEPLQYEKFSPNYVYKNHGEIIEQLNRYKAILTLNRERQEYTDDELLKNVFTEEQKMRMTTMQIRYEAARTAFLSAMKALGYECDRDTFKIIGEVSNQERDAALEKNMEDRKTMRDLGRLDEDADKLIEKKITDAKKEAHEQAVNAAAATEEAYIQELKEKYPESYSDNQETVEKIQADILRLCKKVALQQSSDESVRLELERQKAGQIEPQNKLSGKTVEKLEKRLLGNSAKTELLKKYITNLKETVTTVLNSGELTETGRLLLAKYKGETQIEQKAAAYAKVYGQEAAGGMATYLDKVKNFDSRDLEKCEDNELIEHIEELAELQKANTKVMEAAQKDASLYEQLGGRQLTILKSKLIKYYAEKARSVILCNAYREGNLKQEHFTAEEQAIMKKRFGILQEDEIDATHLYVYMRERMEIKEAEKAEAYNHYFHSDEVRTKYSTHREDKEDYVHVEAIKAIYSTRNLKKGAVVPQKSDMEKAYYRFKQEQNNRQAESIQIYYGLVDNHYKMANGEGIREPIFRSFGNVEHMYGFRDMTDEEFFEMCRKLSAGAFERDKATPEELANYQRENEEGLLIYKENMRMHYEKLEERFHHKVPSLEYMEQNKDELKALLGNLQVDYNLMKNVYKEEGTYLYHLIEVYYAMATYINVVGLTAAQGAADYRDAINANMPILESVQESFAYLDRREQH